MNIPNTTIPYIQTLLDNKRSKYMKDTKEYSIRYWKKRNCTQTVSEILSNIKYPDNVKAYNLANSRTYRIYIKDIIKALEDIKDENKH